MSIYRTFHNVANEQVKVQLLVAGCIPINYFLIFLIKHDNEKRPSANGHVLYKTAHLVVSEAE